MKAAGHKHNRLTPGFTLVELMVAVAVLAIMITIVASIISECHKVVMTSQATMRANNSAGAIAQLLRRDIARISQNGFLCITTDNGRPVMVFMTAGTASTIRERNGNDPILGTGTLTMIGEADNQYEPNHSLLWRTAYVFAPNLGSQWKNDAIGGTDFSNIQSWPRDSADPSMALAIRSWLTAVGPSKFMVTVPVVDMDDVNVLWQVVATHCEDLEILWTNGDLNATTNALEWYGDSNRLGQEPEDIASPNYFALWTHHDQNNWPKAIKISFKLNDPEAPEGDKGMSYEIICPIGQ